MWKAIVSCRAPAITEPVLNDYYMTAQGMPESQHRHYMLELCDMVAMWIDGDNESLPSRFDLAKCAKIQSLFDELSGYERDAAHHLLWYAMEFAIGRTPRTK